MFNPAHNSRCNKCARCRCRTRFCDLSSLVFCFANQLQNFVALLITHHGTELITFINSRTNLESAQCRFKLVRELPANGLMDVEPICRRARGATITHFCDHGTVNSLINIGPFKHKERGIPT